MTGPGGPGPSISGPAAGELLLHASCVALQGRGLVILGPSGSGKSALALELMALGATLVADDHILLRAEPDGLIARCPPQIRGLVEARGVGLLRAESLAETPLKLAVDLDRAEPDRLPPRHHIDLLGHRLDLVLGQSARHLPSALLQYLRAGRYR